ncbi:hypothetical protein B4U80_07651, partial [Leptotrombidium deliense]
YKPFPTSKFPLSLVLLRVQFQNHSIFPLTDSSKTIFRNEIFQRQKQQRLAQQC